MSSDDRTAILGGTFTPIHNGHRAILHKAFQTASHDGSGAGHVIVGLTSPDLAIDTRPNTQYADLLSAYDDRYQALADELQRIEAAYTASSEVVRIEDPYGPAATRADVDALVVSPEASAQRRAHELNDVRVEDGLAPLEVHTAPFVVAEDGQRISSTRIREGEIDTDGQLLE